MVSLNCHTADEEVPIHSYNCPSSSIPIIVFLLYQIPLEPSDWGMIGVIIFFGVLVAAGTLVDIVTNILHLEEQVFSEKAIQMLQGFSLYSNTIKLFHCPETSKDGSLDCIHGIRSVVPLNFSLRLYQVHFHGLGGGGAWLQHV